MLFIKFAQVVCFAAEDLKLARLLNLNQIPCKRFLSLCLTLSLMLEGDFCQRNEPFDVEVQLLSESVSLVRMVCS